MANPLVESDILMVIEMADIPSGSYIYKMDQLGLNAVKFAALNGPQSAVSAMRAVIATLSTDQQQVVSDLVAAYVAVRINAAGVTGGGPSSMTGSSIDFVARMAEYKRMVKIHIPFWTDFSTMESMKETSNLAMSYCKVIS